MTTFSCVKQGLLICCRLSDATELQQYIQMTNPNDSLISENELKRFPLFSFRSTRLWICILLATGLFCTVSMRINLSMAVVCMVNSTMSDYGKGSSTIGNVTYQEEDTCPHLTESKEAVSAGYNGTLEWTPSMQSMLFSATFYSGLIVIAFSGYIADRVGPKAILLAAATDCIVVTFLTPTLAVYSYEAFFASRIAMGLGEGFVFPSLGSMVGKWFAPGEKSTVAALYTSGNQIAASLTSFITAELCVTSLGWPSSFYLIGALGILWTMVWIAIATNTPAKNRWISEEERKYLEHSVPRHSHKKNLKFPWRHILTCVPLYAAISCQFVYNIQASTLQAFLPTYFKEELRIPIHLNGLYSAIPFITQMISKNVFGNLADYLKRNKIISHTTSAKLFQTFGSIGSALTLLVLAFFTNCHNSWTAAPVLGIYGVFFSGGICGFFTSILSIAPAHSGTLTSMSMIFGTLGNLSGPLILTALNKAEVAHKWQILFVTCATLQTIVAVLFICFGSADVQPWATTTPPPAAAEVEKEETKLELTSLKNDEQS